MQQSQLEQHPDKSQPVEAVTASPWGNRRVRQASAAVLLLVALCLVYCSNLRLIAAGDSFPTALTAVSLVVDHSLTLDRFAPWVRTNIEFTRGLVVPADGNYYSVYPIGLSILVAPLIAPAAMWLGVNQWEVPRQVYFARLAEKVSAALITSLTVAVVFLTLRLLVPSGWAWGLSAVFAFGTSSWAIASQALWQQTGDQLCVALMLYFFARWLPRQEKLDLLLLAGLCCATAIWVRPTSVLFAGAFIVPILLWHHNSRAAATFLLFPIIATCALAIYNYHLFGSVLGGYSFPLEYQSRDNQLSPITAFAGVLVSPGKGVFFFSPVLLFAIVGASRNRIWRSPQRSFVLACLLVILGQVLTVSFWPTWWGGASWGWRYLTEIGPPLILLVALAVPEISSQLRLKALFWGLASASIWVQAVGAYCYPTGGWDELSGPTTMSRFWNLSDNPISRNAHSGIDRQPFRSIDRLFHSDTWTLADTWSQASPNDIAMLRWWALPAPQNTPAPDVAKLLESTSRRSVTSCYFDVAKLQLAFQQQVPLSLELSGWAFDATSGTVPSEVLIEVSSGGKRLLVVPARRWQRPDVPVAFHNDRLASSGIAANVLLPQPAPSNYDLKVLQSASREVLECVPTRSHVEK